MVRTKKYVYLQYKSDSMKECYKRSMSQAQCEYSTNLTRVQYKLIQYKYDKSLICSQIWYKHGNETVQQSSACAREGEVDWCVLM